MDSVYKIKVEESDKGKRLDILLSHKIPQYSRSLIKKIIEQNIVKVNSKIEFRANFKPKPGDVIDIKVPAEILVGHNQLIAENIPIEIIYEDENLLAINKPYGMVVHPADGNWNGTLMNAVMYHYKSHMEQINNSIRAGLIHRLDKETSGIVLIGKTNLGLFHFTKLFAERKVDKFYLVLAEGKEDNCSKLERSRDIVVENLLGRNPLNRKKVKSYSLSKNTDTNNSSLRLARTHFYNIAHQGKYFLMLAKPETGRTHQIRVHVKDLNMQIVGDSIYGNMKEENRMMLHAYELIIKNVNLEKLYLKAMPQEDFLNRISQTGLSINDVIAKIDLIINEF